MVGNDVVVNTSRLVKNFVRREQWVIFMELYILVMCRSTGAYKTEYTFC